MEDYKNMETQALLDLLATKTSEYMKMYTGSADPGNMHHLRDHIKHLQAEISSRKDNSYNPIHRSNDNGRGNQYF